MKVLLDACVLFPTVMRTLLIGAAEAGLYQPLWSPRILEEWARAVGRDDPAAGSAVRAEAALLDVKWPASSCLPHQRDLDRLVLPDPNDVHVLASAIAGSADLLVTLNARDFPRHTLNAEGLSRQDPDAFLRALWSEAPSKIESIAETASAQATKVSGKAMPLRSVLKRARLPRLAKALSG
ncbi:MAG: PIN domain-containing protein [Pseudomonadota bacterium]